MHPIDTAGAPSALDTKQIEAGWRDTFSTDNPFCPCNLKSFTKAVRWAERQFVALAAPGERAPSEPAAFIEHTDSPEDGPHQELVWKKDINEELEGPLYGYTPLYKIESLGLPDHDTDAIVKALRGKVVSIGRTPYEDIDKAIAWVMGVGVGKALATKADSAAPCATCGGRGYIVVSGNGPSDEQEACPECHEADSTDTQAAPGERAPSEKTAPVQGYQRGIPWSLHLDAYDAYCKKYGPQPALIDLEGRNCRGGFGIRELDDFVPGWRDKVSEIGKLRAEVERLRASLASTALQAEPTVAAQAEPAGWKHWCETCEGLGTIDCTLGGEHFSNPAAECPDCDGNGYWVRSAQRRERNHD